MDVVKSSRFWIGLAVVISATVLACSGKISGETAIVLMSALLGGFGIGKAGNGGAAKVLIPLALVGSLLLASCTVYQQLARAHVAIEAADKIALDEFGKRCMSAAKACKGKPSEQCPGWLQCDGTRVKYLAAAKAIDDGLAMLNRLLRELGVK